MKTLIHWYKRVLFVNILFDSLGWSLLIPALPQVHSILELNTVTIGSIASLISLLTFLSSTLQGFLTDLFGNRVMLYSSPLSIILGHLIIILSLKYQSVTLFIIGRCLPACFKCGMVVSQALIYELAAMKPSVSSPSSSSYLSSSSSSSSSHLSDDSSDEESIVQSQSMKDFGILYAYSNVAYIVGPVLGGWLCSFHPYSSFVTGICTSIAGILLLQFLPGVQKLPIPTSSTTSPKKEHTGVSSPIPHSKPKNLLANPMLLYYLHVKFAFQVGSSFFEAFFAQYSKNYIGLESRTIGFILGHYGILSLVTNLFLIKLLIKYTEKTRFRMENWFLPLIIGLCLGLCLWSMSTSIPSIVVAVSIIAVVGNLFQSIIQNSIASTQDKGKSVKEKDEMVHDPENNRNEVMALASPRKKSSSFDLNSTPENMKVIRRFFDPRVDYVNASNQISPSSANKPTKLTNKSIGTVFGLSSAADRAARIISPLVGGLFLHSYGATGLFCVSFITSIYSITMLLAGPPFRLCNYLFGDQEVALLGKKKD
jgi:MFS family permease